ncbi:S8 family serine peptidase [bacterium]|nr:S8 family serine peptidase [bacterium]
MVPRAHPPRPHPASRREPSVRCRSVPLWKEIPVRKALVIALATVVLAGALPASADVLDPAVQDQLNRAADGEMISVIVHLREQAPVDAISADLSTRQATRQQRNTEVVRALRETADRTQPPLLDDLSVAQGRGSVAGFTSYWIANIVVVQATEDVIRDLVDRSDIAWIEPNFTVSLIEPVMSADATRDGTELDSRGIGLAPGIEAVRAPEVWNQLGIDGTGALIGSLDTGVDGNHPSLATRWRGISEPASECWLDVIGSGASFPTDYNSHGTHTVGTMCGLAPDDTIGVAPGAQWIACNAIDQGANPGFDNDIIEAFQWFADPDGNPATVDDVPDVVQNSWGVNENFSGYNDCDDRWWAVIDNCEDAGVVVTWSAGNEGPGSGSLRSPADRASNFYDSFSVGSTQYYAPYQISGFSSRGPSTCTGVFDPAYLTKPEIAAPGSDIYSATPNGNYGYKSGTSMAGPHVAGVVALMRSANPDLEVDVIKQVLMDTAVDLGSAGEDNTYGWGFLNAYEAVMAAMNGFGTLEGTVTNASYDEAPLAGARIEFNASAQFLVSGSDGSYSGMVAPGEHVVTCTLDGFAPVEATVTIEEDGLTMQDFSLVDDAGPAITEVTDQVFTTDTVGPYVITADIYDASTVTSAVMTVRINGGTPDAISMVHVEGDTYSAEIAGQPANTTITFDITARDGAGLSNSSTEYTLLVGESVYATAAEDPGDPAWQLGVPGDQATTGLWVRADPVGTDYQGLNVQPEDDHTEDPGVACYVTGNTAPGGEAGDQDVDDGCTTLVTPVFDLSLAERAFVSYWRWYGEGGFSIDDDFVVEITNDGVSWIEFERVPENANSWQRVSVDLGSLAGGAFALTDQVQLRFLACDENTGGLVEAAIDDFEVATFMADVTPVEDTPDAAPAALVLHQNHPNPFNPATTIQFALPGAGAVDLAVYTVDGRRVRTLVDQDLPAGQHQVIWHGRDDGGRRMASGAYFYRLVADDQVQVRRMVLIK